jgi:ribulose-phosphate 3-epimerase
MAANSRYPPVDPGFGGQHFIAGSVDKVARLRARLGARRLDHVEIEVDGGVTADNIAALAEAGMTIAVAGSSIFNPSSTVADNIAALRSASRRPSHAAAAGRREPRRRSGAR